MQFAVSPVFLDRLSKLSDHPLVGETRGQGLICGIELVQNKTTKESFDAKHGVGAKVAQFAQDEGLISRAVGGDTLGLCPPLVIQADQINEAFDAMERGLNRGLNWVKQDLGISISE